MLDHFKVRLRSQYGAEMFQEKDGVEYKAGNGGTHGQASGFLLSWENCRQDALSLKCLGTSLVTQWLRICLPMQGAQVRSLVREDPTCCGAAKPVCHNY